MSQRNHPIIVRRYLAMSKLKKYTTFTSLESGPLAETLIGDHNLLLDQPVGAGGTNRGPTPVDAFLATIGSCLGTVARIVARQKKITLHKMEFKVSGEIDIDVLLGRTEGGAAGFQALHVEAFLESPDLTGEQKMAFLEEVDRRCPVSQTVFRETSLSLGLGEELTTT